MFPNPEIFGVSLEWYSLFQRLAFSAMVIFGGWYYFKKATFRLSILQWIGTFCLLYVVMVGGGRVVGFIETYMRLGAFPEWTVFVTSPSSGNFRWSGSLLACLLLFPWFMQHTIFSNKNLFLNKIPQQATNHQSSKSQDFNALFDMLVLCFCILIMIGKQACQFAGDGCYGVATTLPWGMYYPYGYAPNVIPVHPTPIYDSLFHFIFFIWLLNFDLYKKKEHGQTAKIYFLTIPIFYILLELIRINPVVAFGITLPQVVYMLLLLAWLPIFNFKKLQHHLPNASNSIHKSS